jgi:hypothetical protein
MVLSDEWDMPWQINGVWYCAFEWDMVPSEEWDMVLADE